MQTEPQIVVMLLRDKEGQEVVAQYPFGSWGLKSTMNLAYDLGEKIRSAGEDPSAVIRIAVGDFDWPAQEAIDDMIMFDAVEYRSKLGILENCSRGFLLGLSKRRKPRLPTSAKRSERPMPKSPSVPKSRSSSREVGFWKITCGKGA